MMGFGLIWILVITGLLVIGVGALIVWLIAAIQKGGSNRPLQIGITITLLLVVMIGLVLGVIFLNQVFRWRNHGPGWMMGNWRNDWSAPSWRWNETWPAVGMHGFRSGCGFLNRFNRSSRVTLSIEEAERAANNYLSIYGDDDLIISEIMIFDNHGYAVISERSTGRGAFELLIDPITKRVYPEYGPNMMWNLKYNMHGGPGMMGGQGMHGWFQDRQLDQTGAIEMPIEKAEALLIAQDYLDENRPGASVSDHMTEFYGYYTIDIEIDGEIFGMLSVNGYTGQVFYHHWHGMFIEMSDHF